ncbi:FtsQ-type POTRA domain-containing protein [uncultured Clostridium sp.]|uniref:cell division protein FtsQ/DivIB n=1 Tax=uncultured Clostridium sp. TaxID=59620 RepID=UPI0025E5F0BF|nr:FtsQ-type POTRA domain-containing protein [uncultured Clostridium sp.]
MSTIKSVKKPTNEFIIRQRKRKLMRKIILMCVVLFIGVILFITKSNVFIIKKVSVLGNPIMSGEDVKERTQYLIGQNIFFIKKGEIVKTAEKNPYVKSIEISKTYPRQINIKIIEKQGVFCSEINGQYYVFSDRGILLEKTDNINNRNLINILGIDEEINNIELGQAISENLRMINILNTFSQIAQVNPSTYKIDYIDLSDFMNIKVYIGDVEGRLGNDEKIPEKMNKLIHIVENPQIGIEKGYVDVGFDGSPVYYKEEVKNEEGDIENEGV